MAARGQGAWPLRESASVDSGLDLVAVARVAGGPAGFIVVEDCEELEAFPDDPLPAFQVHRLGQPDRWTQQNPTMQRSPLTRP